MFMLKMGLLINPLAGLGGSRGLKGSDGSVVRELADTLSEQELLRSNDRAKRALEKLVGIEELQILTWGGAMGADLAQSLGLEQEELFDFLLKVVSMN